MTTPWAAAPTLQGYQVLEAIGQGGFGTVYRAHQLAVGREVARHLLPPPPDTAGRLTGTPEAACPGGIRWHNLGA